MKPPPFDYVLAKDVPGALDALARAGADAKIIAGGQSLVPMLNFRLLRPSVLIDINRIEPLSFIRDEGGSVRIGALTRHHQAETSPLLAACFPVIADAMRHVAHLAIRNRGSIGGSLSHADPAAEWPMLAMLLDATMTVASMAGERRIAAREFFLDALTTDLRDGELLTAISLPKLPPNSGWAFEEVARRGGDFALAAAGAILTVSGGVVTQARVAAMGVAKTPLRIAEAEALLTGRTIDATVVERAAGTAREAVEPDTDLHASADYRRHLIGVLVRHTLSAAWRRATAAAP